MSEQPTRSKTRSKGRASRQIRTEELPRPGERPSSSQEQQQQPYPPSAGAAAAHPGAATGGRRAHRGSQRSEVEAVQHGMAALQVAGESAGRGAMRRRDDYELDNTRPPQLQNKSGESGEKMGLVANYFDVIAKQDWVVHQYHVDFVPNVESIRVRKAMIASHKETLGQCYLFDGMSDLKTVTKLEKDVTEVYSQRQSDGETITISFKRVTELPSKHPELYRLFNTQMRRNLQHLKYQLLGRYYYDPNAIIHLENFNLQIWPGFITSIRTQEERLMMVVDTTHKVVRMETANDIIRNIARRNERSDWRSIVQDTLVGSIVMTKYNNRTYRVEDVLWNENPTKTFETKQKTSIKYVDYFRMHWEENIRDLNQPLLCATSKERELRGGESLQKKVNLIPELCFMTGLTDEMRANFTMMKELAAHTKQTPASRVSGLKSFIQKINQNPDCDREMKAWGLRFGSELAQVTGRQLPAEKIVQGNSRMDYNQSRGDFGQVMRGTPMHSSRNLDEWVLIVTKTDSNRSNDFLMNLRKVGPPMGMRITNPRVIVIENDRIQNYIQALREGTTPNTQMVVFIVPNNKKERYDALKKHCCIDNPIPSQVVIGRTLSKPKTLMSIVTKIGIQMSCKLGGEAWAMEIPIRKGLMVIGFDTYHDSSRKGQSAGGFVASFNNSITQWHSRVSFHQKGGWEELSNHLEVHITEALKKYQAVNGALPSIILFYRDGVGDGQIRYVLEHELKQFEKTIARSISGQSPRYAFIVVNKKINTRFFATRGAGRFDNPPPGTCVDSVVTRFDRYDFFLVSQSVREGTVGPTMYNIIRDCSGFKPDHLQRLTYKLTHLYYNFQGTISVPAPCQYAHKLAFLCGQSLHREPAPQLCDQLFYL